MSSPDERSADEPAQARPSLDPDPPRPPGAPDLDLDIPRPDQSDTDRTPENEDVPKDADKEEQEPPD